MAMEFTAPVETRVKNAQPNLLSPYYRLEEWWIEPAP